jgi:phenylpropionate dioxygenase-like ring-hydroxylating dioxygenase large terminal subunit
MKDLPAANTSIVVIRGKDGVVRAFHNICSHRGNKLVWDGKWFLPWLLFLQISRWTYNTTGELVNVPDEEMFHDFRKSKHGLVFGRGRGVGKGSYLSTLIPTGRRR